MKEKTTWFILKSGLHSKLAIFIFSFGLLYFLTGFNSQTDPVCKVFVKVIEEQDFTKFQGVFENNSSDSIVARYQMETIKKGPSGTSVSRQGGQIFAAPSDRVELSHARINIEEGDYYNVVVKILRNESVLCTDSLTVIHD